MVEVKVYKSGSVSTQPVDTGVFGERVLGRTLKDAVVMYEANRRQGTHKAKTRAEVKGPNNKLWKQKHTGRARMGTRKSPVWRGGGIVFGPRPRDYSYSIPRKVRRLALRNAVYTKFRDGEVAVAEGFPSDAPSTRQAMSVLKALGMDQSALVVTDGIDRNLYLSLRNVPYVDVAPVSDLNAHQVLVHQHMVLTPAAMDALQQQMQAGASKAATGNAGA